MRALIRAKYPKSQDDNKWLDLLKPERQEKVKEKWQEATQENYELSFLEYTDFCDKRDIVKKLGSFGERFKKDFEKIEKYLRNPIAHGGDYARNDEEMKLFIKYVNLAEEWIDKLQPRV